MAAVLTVVALSFPLAGCDASARDDSQKSGLAKLESPVRFTSGAAVSAFEFSVAPGLMSKVSGSAPSELTIYQVTKQVPTRDMVCDIGERVGISVLPEIRARWPERDKNSSYQVGMIGRLTSPILLSESNVDENDRYISAVLGETEEQDLVLLEVHLRDDGNFKLRPHGTWPRPEEEALTDERTLAIAKEFVEQTQLLPDGCQLVGVFPTTSVGFEAPGEKGVKERVIGKQVIYKRHLDGYPDGQFIVQVNGRGQIFGVHRNARNVAPLAQYPILTPEEALESLRAGRGSLSGPTIPGKIAAAVVEEITIVYDEGAFATSYETIQPVYRLRGSVEGFNDGFSASVPAVRPEYLEGK